MCMKKRLYDYFLWNIFILTVGALLVTLSVQSIAAPHGFLTGGVMGLGLLSTYITGMFNGTTWNLFYNLPILFFGWVKISKRFIFYSIYGTFAISAWGIILGDYTVPVQDPLYASILSGVLFGGGGGMMLRTKGSSGGLDIIGVYLNERYGMSIGGFAFSFNVVLFSLSLISIRIDLIIVSFIQVFIVRQVMNYVIGMFNQRKMVFVVTSKGQEIAEAIAEQGGRTTILPAFGGYRHDTKEIIMTITTNATIRTLEELVFIHDPHALFSVENTFYVSGGQYKRESR